jgi:Arc/MetJ-type ribon-helix-helix transcriptional regulator
MRNTPITITVKLPESLARRLDAEARRRGSARSVFVREAIEAALRRQDGRGTNGSVLSHCRDLAGCVDGPSDLSYAARHMRGFGRRR